MAWIRIYPEDLYSIVADQAETFRMSVPDAQNFINLLFAGGFRIREVYETDRWEIFNAFYYIVRTEKGSNPRYWPIAQTPADMRGYIDDQVPAYQNFRYNTFCRWFRKTNPYNLFLVGEKQVTSHIYRYNRINYMHMTGCTDQEIADFVGEVSLENVRGYYTIPIYRMQY